MVNDVESDDIFTSGHDKYSETRDSGNGKVESKNDSSSKDSSKK